MKRYLTTLFIIIFGALLFAPLLVRAAECGQARHAETGLPRANRQPAHMDGGHAHLHHCRRVV